MRWLLCLIIFHLSLILTGIMKKIAWKYGVVDLPDARRSHLISTPRCGGMAIMLSFFIWMVYFIQFNGVAKHVWMPWLPGFVIGLMGLWDDISPLSAKLRLFLQFSCTLMSLILLGGIEVQIVFFDIIVPSWLVFGIAWVFMVWCINLYNFMDGINGIAGIEALSVSISMSILTLLELQYHWSLIWAIFASAVAGFLIWNFPKAKIFLGDVGSQFIGYMFAILLIESAQVKPRWFWCGLILLGFFVVDATVTLLVRLWYRQEVLKPHKTHAFQILLRNLNGSHTMVTAGVLCINVLWLMPWAILVYLSYLPGFLGLVLSYLPLVFLVYKVEAGRPVDF